MKKDCLFALLLAVIMLMVWTSAGLSLLVYHQYPARTVYQEYKPADPKFFEGSWMKLIAKQWVFENHDGSGRIEIFHQPYQVKLINLGFDEAAELFWQCLKDSQPFWQMLADGMLEIPGLAFGANSCSAFTPQLIIFAGNSHGKIIVNQKTGEIRIVNLQLDKAAIHFWRAVQTNFPKKYEF